MQEKNIAAITTAVRTTAPPAMSRRALLGALAVAPWLAGCSTPLPLAQAPAGDRAAAERLRESAEAHGLAAYRGLTDINVSYDGAWRPLINRIQPQVVDAGFRGPSQERLLPRAGIVAQAYTGPRGRKQVVWRRGPMQTARDGGLGEVAVWFNGQPSSDAAAQSAAALVAEAYGLFLLGPLWLVDRNLRTAMGGAGQVDGRACDIVQVWMAPGLGRSEQDRVALYVDRKDSLVRRMQFTLEGFPGTRGAVAEVDTYDHERRFGVVWPMRSFERVVHPIALPAHDWRITGLDVNRGYGPDDLAGPSFTGAAAAAAQRL